MERGNGQKGSRCNALMEGKESTQKEDAL